MPGVARRLAHRRRCQPGDGDGGGGRQLRRVVGRRWSGAGAGSRERAVAWARVKRTHLSRRRRRQRRIAVSHDAWCTRGVATQRRGDEADDRTRIAALPTATNSAQGDWPGDGGAHARQLARRFERAAFRAALRRVARGRDGGARATPQGIDSFSMQVCAALGC